jgi:catechol 2,3-dioxygenase-like lactoylglutathione lyase family enzyme
VNHLAFVVADVDACAARLDAAGFQRSIATKEHPARKRVYFYDKGGLEWELIQYLTDVMEDRHSYDLPN